MPLPMVHLAVAQAMCRLKGTLPDRRFLLGSISPDAIHARKGAVREDKRRTHMASVENGVEPSWVQTMLHERWNEGENVPFSEGYATHLLTDRLWQRLITIPFKRRIVELGRVDETRALYYRDCDRIDYDIYDQADWRASAWAALSSVPSLPFADLLEAREIEAWRDRTLGWFEGHPQMRSHDPVYITLPMVGEFIAQAAKTVSETLDQWRGR